MFKANLLERYKGNIALIIVKEIGDLIDKGIAVRLKDALKLAGIGERSDTGGQ